VDPEEWKTISMINKEWIYDNFDNFDADFKAWIDKGKNEKFYIGQEAVLGRTCKVYDFGNRKSWYWNDLELKHEWITKNFHESFEAISITENIDISHSLFELPTDIPLKKSDQHFDEMIKGWGDTITSSTKTDEETPVGYFDVGLAIMGNADAEKKILNGINNDPAFSDEEKNTMIQNFKEMSTYSQKIYDEARDEDGVIDMSKMIDLLKPEIFAANEALAQSTLRTISTALETYATVNMGDYPESMEDLINADPPYINKDYCEELISHYKYECELTKKSYLITASSDSQRPDKKIFSIMTGAVLNSE